MTNIKKIVLLSFMSAFAFNCVAAAVSQPATVKTIQIYGDPSQNFEDVFFTTCGKNSNGGRLACVSNTDCVPRGWILKRSHPMFSELYSTLLAASLSQAPIGVVGEGSCASFGYEAAAEFFLNFD